MEMNGISSPGSLIPKVRTWTRLSLSPLSVLEFMTLTCSPASAAENQGSHWRTDAVVGKEAWQVSTQDAGGSGAWQNWEQGCSDCELDSELRAWGRSGLGEDGVGLLRAVGPGGRICNRTFLQAAAAAAKSLRSCPTLCDPIAGSPPGSPFPGILQAETLEWVAISFSIPSS